MTRRAIIGSQQGLNMSGPFRENIEQEVHHIVYATDGDTEDLITELVDWVVGRFGPPSPDHQELKMDEITQAIYPCVGGHDDKLTVVCAPDDECLRIEASAADPFYLSRNQVRCLMHQLTDWLT